MPCSTVRIVRISVASLSGRQNSWYRSDQTLGVRLGVKHQNSAGVVGKVDAIVAIYQDDGLFELAFLQTIDDLRHSLFLGDDRAV